MDAREESALMDAETITAMGDWLNGFTWDYFGTFTFRKARRTSGIDPVIRWWNYMAAGCPSVGARAFVCDESHRDGERIHVHALLQSDPQAHQDYLWGSWRKYWGRERILKFDQSLGASWYCSKYLLKEKRDTAEWKLVEWHEGLLSDGSDLCLDDRPTSV